MTPNSKTGHNIPPWDSTLWCHWTHPAACMAAPAGHRRRAAAPPAVVLWAVGAGAGLPAAGAGAGARPTVAVVWAAPGARPEYKGCKQTNIYFEVAPKRDWCMHVSITGCVLPKYLDWATFTCSVKATCQIFQSRISMYLCVWWYVHVKSLTLYQYVPRFGVRAWPGLGALGGSWRARGAGPTLRLDPSWTPAVRFRRGAGLLFPQQHVINSHMDFEQTHDCLYT